MPEQIKTSTEAKQEHQPEEVTAVTVTTGKLRQHMESMGYDTKKSNAGVVVCGLILKDSP